MRKGNSIDRLALIIAVVFTIGIAVLTSRWYNIRWEDITKCGFSGLPIFIGMFAFTVGVPVYMGIRIFRMRGVDPY
jgi:phosphatidylserine synthase